ncbi:MAG: hypothetical protein LBF67_08560 [Prevotellaceae bacterium]|nr:hypothetical protein [Prevotellaceae bacterium]
MKKNLLYKKTLACIALTVAMPFMLNAQKDSEEGNSKMDKLIAKRNVAQARVNKAEAEKRSADSLITAGAQHAKKEAAEMEAILDDQAKLERRVFDVELPPIEKQTKSKDKQEQAQAVAKKAEIRKSYNAEINLLKSRHTASQKRKKEAELSVVRGQEKLKLVDKTLKDAITALKAVEKEMEALEEAEKNKERTAQQAQKRKEDEIAAKQKQKEIIELKKQKDREEMQAKREAEKAKRIQEREELKNKETGKKEKETLQRQKDKDEAKRKAEQQKK